MRLGLAALCLIMLAGVAAAGIHVLIGVVPSRSFVVTLNGEEIPGSPAISDPAGILDFEIASGSGTVCVALEGAPRPAVICSEIPR